MAVDWWGRVWDNDPARKPPPPDAKPTATWLGVATAVHGVLPVVSELWWATMPEPGEVWATAQWPDVLRRVDPGLHQDLLQEVAREASRLAGGREHGCPQRLPVPPYQLPPACRHLLPRPPPPPPPVAPALG